MEILDRVSNTFQGWNTLEADRGAYNYSISASSEQKVLYYLVAQEVAHMRMEIVLLTKKFTTMKSKR